MKSAIIAPTTRQTHALGFAQHQAVGAPNGAAVSLDTSFYGAGQTLGLVFTNNALGGALEEAKLGILGDTNYGANMTFSTKPNDGNPGSVDRVVMTLTDGGMLGIGTTTPSATLEVNGGAKVDGTITATGSITATAISTSGSIISSGVITAQAGGDIPMYTGN
jgi:hypothetical protein